MIGSVKSADSAHYFAELLLCAHLSPYRPACRYLEYVVFKEQADKVCFVTPDVTQFIKLYGGALARALSKIQS